MIYKYIFWHTILQYILLRNQRILEMVFGTKLHFYSKGKYWIFLPNKHLWTHSTIVLTLSKFMQSQGISSNGKQAWRTRSYKWRHNLLLNVCSKRLQYIRIICNNFTIWLQWVVLLCLCYVWMCCDTIFESHLLPNVSADRFGGVTDWYQSHWL